MARAEAALERLQSRVEALDKERFEDNLRDSAFLKPDDTGYSELATGYGTITVQIADVAAYSNGSRVTLLWGNPTSAEITSLKAKLSWGPVTQEGYIDYDKDHEREHTFKADLPAGQWTETKVDLGNTPPQSLGFIMISEAVVGGVNLLKSAK